MAITGHAFYLKTIGKVVDVDGYYGGQCWDLWAYHQVLNNIPVIHTSITEFARDIWNDRANNGVLKNYEAISDINKLKDGDWVICEDISLYPSSHIFMFRMWVKYPNAIMLGQNQRGGKIVTQEEWALRGFLGAFRLKTKTSPAPVEKVYQAHVQNIGWQNAVGLEETAGTTGKSLRLEAIRINIKGFEFADLHIANVGWKRFTSGDMGTTGKGLAIEDIILKIPGYEFRVHMANIGWTTWTSCDGKSSLGSVGQSRRLEAIQIRKRK